MTFMRGEYMILQTERLYLREMTIDDMEDLKLMLQDIEVMYAYEHAFRDEEVMEWLQKQRTRYQVDGIGLWAVIRKTDHKMIGQCGLTWQNTDREKVMEIGFILRKCVWHQGYAREAASGCKQYAFEKLKQERVVSIIRENNLSSIAVALSCGMQPTYTFVKYYHQTYMPHIVFEVKKEGFYEKRT